MRRFRDWVRAEVSAVLRPELEAVRDELQRSLRDTSTELQQQISHEHAQTRQTMLERQLELSDRTRSLFDALDQMRAHLDTIRAAQRAELGALEANLREIVINVGPATVLPPAIVAGSIDPATPVVGTVDRDIDLTERLEPGALVDARSRFDESWFEGLEVAEIVPEAAGRERYRLARRRDGRTLPMLFDAVDLRPASATSGVPN
jgi:hypothetical protein